MDKAAKRYAWEQKTNKIFWRGGEADVTGYRHALVDLSKQLKYEKIDAQFTYGSLATAAFLPTEEHVKYKFQINIDGHTAAWERPVWQLYSGCVMLKQASKLVQWYYDAIQPDVHFIEVGNNPHDLLHIMERYTDAEFKRIRDNARAFAKENLSFEDMLAHIILVLQSYEKLQVKKTPYA